MQNQHIKIYTDGKLNRWATYKPVLCEKMAEFGDKVDYWFTHYGEWPQAIAQNDAVAESPAVPALR